MIAASIAFALGVFLGAGVGIGIMALMFMAREHQDDSVRIDPVIHSICMGGERVGYNSRMG